MCPEYGPNGPLPLGLEEDIVAVMDEVNGSMCKAHIGRLVNGRRQQRHLMPLRLKVVSDALHFMASGEKPSIRVHTGESLPWYSLIPENLTGGEEMSTNDPGSVEKLEGDERGPGDTTSEPGVDDFSLLGSPRGPQGLQPEPTESPISSIPPVHSEILPQPEGRRSSERPRRGDTPEFQLAKHIFYKIQGASGFPGEERRTLEELSQMNMLELKEWGEKAQRILTENRLRLSEQRKKEFAEVVQKEMPALLAKALEEQAKKERGVLYYVSNVANVILIALFLLVVVLVIWDRVMVHRISTRDYPGQKPSTSSVAKEKSGSKDGDKTRRQRALDELKRQKQQFEE